MRFQGLNGELKEYWGAKGLVKGVYRLSGCSGVSLEPSLEEQLLIKYMVQGIHRKEKKIGFSKMSLQMEDPSG